MLSVLLTILKIIGIILLCILIFIVLLIAAALFVPVRYKAVGSYEKTEEIHVKATWLLFVLRFHFQMKNKDMQAILRIFGYPISLYPKEEKEQSFQKKEKHRSNKKTKKEHSNRKKKPKEANTNQSEEKEMLEQKENSSSEHLDDLNKQQEKPVVKIEESSNSKQESPFQKIKSILENFWKKLLQIPEKIKELISKASDIKAMLIDEKNKLAVAHMWKEVKYACKHFRPRKVKADITFGTNDPATTGQILGVVCLLPMIYKYKMHVIPDFESEKFYVRGNAQIKGHIRLIHALLLGIRVFFDKNIKRLIKMR